MNVARMTTAALGLLVSLSIAASAQGASAKGQGKRIDSAASAAKKSEGKAAEGKIVDASSAKVKGGAARSTDDEARIIRDYFAGRSQKPKPLPPGIAKRLERGKPLPPGIARTRMPDDLARRLPRRDSTRWILAGDNAVLVDLKNTVLDVIRALPTR